MKLFTIEHIHRWENGQHADRDLLVEIFKELKLINKQNIKIMADLQTFQDALNKIDAATTKAATAVAAIGDRIKTLEDQIKNGGLTAEQENTFLGTLQGVAANAEAVAGALEQIGKTPENPVPVEPPVDGGTGTDAGTGGPGGTSDQPQA